MTKQAKLITQIIYTIFITSVLLLAPTPVGAQQSPEETAQKYGVAFPIAQLGNCPDYGACRTYCEDPLNHDKCIDFAKQKGFYKEPEIATNKQQIIANAAKELGCDSETSCMSLCGQSSNYDRCGAFANKHNLQGGHVANPQEKEIIQKAQQVLGCDSPQSCAQFCGDPANRQKCTDFAQQVGLRGGEQPVGPGGCTSPETCQTFCSDPNNYQICQQYTTAHGEKFSGPGGCGSEESCRTYCQDHPQECGHRPGSQTQPYNPQEMCQKTPNCSWANDRCQCSSNTTNQDHEKFCRDNPEKCRQQDQDYQKYCRENPDKCKHEGPTGYDQAQQCRSYPGCWWTGSTCQCSPSGSITPYPTSNYHPTPASTSQYDPATQCAKSPGCSFEGSSCKCPDNYYNTTTPVPSGSTTNYPGTDAATECGKTSGCWWTGSTCQCSQTSTSTSPPPDTTSTSQPTSAPQPTSSSTPDSTSQSQPTSSSPDQATECAKTSGCWWTGSTCQCSQVQGTSRQRSTFQLLFNWLNSLWR